MTSPTTSATSPRSTYRTAIDQLAAAQKPGAGVPAYMRYPNRWLGRRLAALAFVLGRTANQVTVVSFLLTLAGLALLIALEPTWVTGIVVSGLLLLGLALDSADGQLSRLVGSSGPSGEWLDHVVDATRQPLQHLAVFWWASMHVDVGLPLIAAVTWGFLVTTSVRFFSQTLAEQLLRGTGPQPVDAGGHRQGSTLVQTPADPGVLYLSFCLVAAPSVFFGVYSVIFVANLVLAAVSLRRRFRSLSRIAVNGQ